MRKLLLLSAGILFCLAGAIPPSDAQEVCIETSGQVTRHDYIAPSIETRMYYTVYTPPCYNVTEDRYPVLYLLHGSNEDDGQWLRLGLQGILDEGILDGSIPPMVVVLPFGNWIANENVFGDFSWDEVFLEELMPLVEGQYRVNANRENRAIGGISRGGFWAFMIAFRNPALFSAVGGHSAFFDVGHAPADFNPLNLALDAPGIDRMRIWLDRGVDDFAADGLDLMNERLTTRGLSFIYTIHPEGQHDNSYWREHVDDYIAFYVADWLTVQTVEAPPSVVEPLPTSTETPLVEMTPETTTQVIEATEAVVVQEDLTTQARYLFLPVVAFPSLEANLSTDVLNTIRGGLLVPNLVLTESTVTQLQAFGVSLAVGTRIVPDGELFNILWRDTGLFSLMPFDQIYSRYRVLNVDELHPLDQLETYPFSFESATPNFYPDRLTRIVLSGVTALTRYTIPALDENGLEWAASGIQPYVDRADYFHTSNEVSFVPGCTFPSSEPTESFCSKEEHFALFPLIGLDIVELTGNHNNDRGNDAYRATLQWFDDHGIETVGGGETLDEAREPLILTDGENSIAMVACNWPGPYYAQVNEDPNLLGGVRPGAAKCDSDWLRETLGALQAAHDLVIMSVQYWEFEQYQPSGQQRLDFRTFADWGADVVIGSQAHFSQSFEFYPVGDGRDAFIHYGLGNLFFDQGFFGGQRFFMDQLFVYEGRLLFVDLFTGLIEGLGRPRAMTPDERINFLYLILIENGSW